MVRKQILTTLCVAGLIVSCTGIAFLLLRQSFGRYLNSTTSQKQRPHSNRDGFLQQHHLDLALIGILEEVRIYPHYSEHMGKLVMQLYDRRIIEHSVDFALIMTKTVPSDLIINTEAYAIFELWSRIADAKAKVINGISICDCSDKLKLSFNMKEEEKSTNSAPVSKGNLRSVITNEDRKIAKKLPQLSSMQEKIKPELRDSHEGQQGRDYKQKIQPTKKIEVKNQSKLIRGMANAHYWLNVCGRQINILEKHPNFPQRVR